MIAYDDVVPLLVAACPPYDESSERAAVVWEDGAFLHAARIVQLLVRLLDSGETASFPAVFRVADYMLEAGDPAAITLVRDGFFQDLITPESYRGCRCRPADFLRWLGPQAKSIPFVGDLANSPGEAPQADNGEPG